MNGIINTCDLCILFFFYELGTQSYLSLDCDFLSRFPCFGKCFLLPSAYKMPFEFPALYLFVGFILV